ncbi:MAG: hypothetical protein HOF01_12560 [Chloroflexi bacterium]|jgi:hypothetical protein|nr:hypothetical protein [Chloroflexota bacterium]
MGGARWWDVRESWVGLARKLLDRIVHGEVRAQSPRHYRRSFHFTGVTVETMMGSVEMRIGINPGAGDR